ncbi:MAG TPA: hypothetical protein VJL90_01035 [Pseudorhodoplanes sp.]|nr:hypothetical protein [Pseudorhodoplanes sp.]
MTTANLSMEDAAELPPAAQVKYYTEKAAHYYELARRAHNETVSEALTDVARELMWRAEEAMQSSTPKTGQMSW